MTTGKYNYTIEVCYKMMAGQYEYNVLPYGYNQILFL